MKNECVAEKRKSRFTEEHHTYFTKKLGGALDLFVFAILSSSLLLRSSVKRFCLSTYFCSVLLQSGFPINSLTTKDIFITYLTAKTK